MSNDMQDLVVLWIEVLVGAGGLYGLIWVIHHFWRMT